VDELLGGRRPYVCCIRGVEYLSVDGQIPEHKRQFCKGGLDNSETKSLVIRWMEEQVSGVHVAD
jgi:hypothetical protein